MSSMELLNNFIKAIREPIVVKSRIDDSDGLLRISLIAKSKSAKKFLYPELDGSNLPDLKELAFHLSDKLPTGHNVLIHPLPRKNFYTITALRSSFRAYLESTHNKDSLSGPASIQPLSRDYIILPEYGAIRAEVLYSRDADPTKYPWVEVMVAVKTSSLSETHDQNIAVCAVQSIRSYLDFYSDELKTIVPGANAFYVCCEYDR